MKKDNNPPRRRGRPVEAGGVHAASWRSKAEDLAARLDDLHETWIAADAWRTAWTRYCDAVERLSAGWPRAVAGRTRGLNRDDLAQLARADGPLVVPVAHVDDYRKAARLVGDLLADVDAWPIVEREVRAQAAAGRADAWLVTRELTHLGATLRAGRWHRPSSDRPAPWMDPALQAAVHALDQAEAERRAPAPVLRPLLDALHKAIEPANRALARAIAPPSPSRLPPVATTSAAAREEWLRLRTAYVRHRIAVRHHHRRRAALHPAITSAITSFTSAWRAWPGAVIHVVADDAAALAALQRLHADALARLRDAAEAS